MRWLGFEGFAGAQDAENEMKQLGHVGTDDDDGFLAFGFESFGEGFAKRVEAHGTHGRKEQGFAESRGAGLAHRGVVRSAGAALLPPGSVLRGQSRKSSISRQGFENNSQCSISGTGPYE